MPKLLLQQKNKACHDVSTIPIRISQPHTPTAMVSMRQISSKEGTNINKRARHTQWMRSRGKSSRIPSLPTHHQTILTSTLKEQHKPSSLSSSSRNNTTTTIMFPIIDNFLLSHAPPWYRTTKSQTITLGIVFFWVFAAYTTIQFYSASTYGSELAADCVSAVYLTFTLTCLISPGIINKWGCRLSMFWGVLGYASLVLSSLVYFLYGGKEDDVLWARRLVVLGGAVLGCGAATLWTAQGRLILQLASRADELDNNNASSFDDDDPTIMQSGEKKKKGKSSPTKSHTGKLMGLFWVIFQCSSLVGGSISFIYYNQKPKGSTALYSVFLSFIVMGAMFTQLLLPPSMLQNPNKNVGVLDKRTDVEMTNNEQTPLNVDAGAAYTRSGESSQQLTENGMKICEDLSSQSWWQEAQGTLQMFFNKRMMFLSPLFFYTVRSYLDRSFVWFNTGS